MAAVELHTIGRKSGQRRSVMLTAPVREPGRVVLVASKGGDDRHPEWYLNLVADPDVELTIDGSTKPMTARTAAGAERAELSRSGSARRQAARLTSELAAAAPQRRSPT